MFECGLCLLQGPEGSTLQYMGLSISQEQSVLSSLIPQSLALGFPNILCCEQPFLLTAAVGNGFTSQSIGVALSLHHPQGFSCSGTRRQGYSQENAWPGEEAPNCNSTIRELKQGRPQAVDGLGYTACSTLLPVAITSTVTKSNVFVLHF